MNWVQNKIHIICECCIFNDVQHIHCIHSKTISFKFYEVWNSLRNNNKQIWENTKKEIHWKSAQEKYLWKKKIENTMHEEYEANVPFVRNINIIILNIDCMNVFLNKLPFNYKLICWNQVKVNMNTINILRIQFLMIYDCFKFQSIKHQNSCFFSSNFSLNSIRRRTLPFRTLNMKIENTCVTW